MNLIFCLVLLTTALARLGEARGSKLLKSIKAIQKRAPSCPVNTNALSKQWYLEKLNVFPAWADGYTGNGIVVGVVDVGVNGRPELQMRPDLAFKPWESQPYRARHGTEVAGVIAARTCDSPLGIAYDAQIADIRALSADSTTNVRIDALNHRLDGIHIFSSSFTNFHTGFTIHPLSESTRSYLRYGTKRGRVGKGAIYVWSTGNSGGNSIDRDSCAYDGYINNPYVIPVAGVSHDYQPITEGEECSAIMVSSFTSNFHQEPGQFGIYTLDGDSDFTPFFGQNSAAVPMVSAAIALTLQANMNLTYRDVMHILVKTARSKEVFSEQVYHKYFKKNAVALPVSSRFGFGVIDIKAMVDASKNWNNVPALQTFSMSYIGRYTLSRLAKSYQLLYMANSITHLEHVELSVNYNAVLGGQIKWYLESPQGTQSEVLPGRYLDIHRQINVTVVSVQFWGENPRGNWTLTADINDDKHYGYILSWSVKLYGYSKESSTSSQNIHHGNNHHITLSPNGLLFGIVGKR